MVNAEDAVDNLVTLCLEIASGAVRRRAVVRETNLMGTQARAAPTNAILFYLIDIIEQDWI